jgi:hypothetical protein
MPSSHYQSLIPVLFRKPSVQPEGFRLGWSMPCTRPHNLDGSRRGLHRADSVAFVLVRY